MTKEGIFELKIIDKKCLNHNTFLITLKGEDFLFPDFPVSSFCRIYTNDLKFSNPYTPISSDISHVTFAIKIYPNGKMSNYIFSKNIGDFLKISSPIIKLKFDCSKYKDILLIAGGTGITPMLQILKFADKQKKKPNFTLFFCNLSKEDIFLRNELLKYQSFVKIIHVLENSSHFDKGVVESLDKNQIDTKDENNSALFDICTLKNPREIVKYGRINFEIVGSEVLIENEILFDFCYVSGPPGFMKVVSGDKNIDKSQGKLEGILRKIGFKSNMVYKF